MNDMFNQGCGILKSVLTYLEKWQLVKPIQLAVLTVLCFIAGRLVSYVFGWGNSYFSGFWVMLVALVITKESDIHLHELQRRLMAVALGVVAGFVVLSVFGVNFVSLFVSVILVAWGCAFFNWHQYQQMAILSLAVLIVANYLMVDIELWAGAIGRVLEAAIGMALAYGTHMFFKGMKDCCHKSGN